VAVDIVGRISQRAQLLRWLAGAIDGHPAVVILDGPPGVGKSTLVEWLIAQSAERGAMRQLVAVPEQGDVADELRRALDEVDDRLRRGVPQLVVIDDAHWLDDAGQHQIEHLAFRLATASLTGQQARICVLLVARDEPSWRLMARLIDEPITRRITLDVLDDREARELATRISPGITDRRTIARLVELSGGNPLTLNALADSMAVGEALPPPASTTGTIPVEVAWRARLSTCSADALRAAVVIALAAPPVQHRVSGDADLLAGAESAVEELVSIGAVRRSRDGVAFTHPLLRTTALDLAEPELICEVAGDLLDRLDGGIDRAAGAGMLVRLADAARRTASDRYLELLRSAYHEAIGHGSWSAAGDLAESIVERAADDSERAYWLERLGKARFNELDRDEATAHLIEAAELHSRSVDGANGRAECLLLALRTDFTRSGFRRHPDLDAQVNSLIDDVSVDRHWRAQSAAILAEISWAGPHHEDRLQFVDTAHLLAEGIDDPMTRFQVNFATGWHHLATLQLEGAQRYFTLADEASRAQPDPWWLSASVARRGLVDLLEGNPMAAITDTTAAAETSTRSSNWAEHGQAVAARSVAETRLGRFADADNDTESTMLSARRADSAYPFLECLPTAMWRRAVRGDEAGVDAVRGIARQVQIYMPFAELVAVSLLRGIDAALDDVTPRWALPRAGLSFRNIGFHSAQFEAAVIAGNLEILDGLYSMFGDAYQRGVRAASDWPTSVALAMASAAIDLGDGAAESWIDRAQESAAEAGSVLEQAIVDVCRSRHAFAHGRGGQVELDRGRAALETLDGLGAPLLARLQRERLTAVVGQVGMPAGRERTVMFTDIVNSTSLMSSAGNAGWAVVLGEHHRLVRTVVGQHRGSIMTATGDGFAAWFEQPGDAVEAARALHQAIDLAGLVVPGGTVKVRVGIASGSVFDLGSDASGMAVAEAARVMSTAGPGEIHVSRSVVDHGFAVAADCSIGLHTLKGLPQPIEIFSLAPVGTV
jgi:class 3 adenylate cyclase